MWLKIRREKINNDNELNPKMCSKKNIDSQCGDQHTSPQNSNKKSGQPSQNHFIANNFLRISEKAENCRSTRKHPFCIHKRISSRLHPQQTAFVNSCRLWVPLYRTDKYLFVFSSFFTAFNLKKYRKFFIFSNVLLETIIKSILNNAHVSKWYYFFFFPVFSCKSFFEEEF